MNFGQNRTNRKIFSDNDKQILKELILNEKKILESKRMDGVTLKQKADVWNKITENFNRETRDNRTIAQLRKLWDNMKTQSRRALALERRERMMASGGPCLSQTDTQDMSDISDVIKHEIPSANDSDTLHLNNDQNEPVSPNLISNCYRTNESFIVGRESLNSATQQLGHKGKHRAASIQDSSDDSAALTSEFSSDEIEPHISVAWKTRRNKKLLDTKGKQLSPVDEAKLKFIKLKGELLIKESEENLKHMRYKRKLEKKEHERRMELLAVQIQKEKKSIEFKYK